LSYRYGKQQRDHPTIIPNWVIAPVVPCSHADRRETAGNKSHGASQKGPAPAAIGRQIWRPRSLIIQAECETFAATERYIDVLAQ
jgi:hypothetical protein